MATNSFKNSWRIKPDKDFQGLEQWRPPGFDQPGGAWETPNASRTDVPAQAEDEPPPPTLPTLQEIEEIQRQAREEGYEHGKAEGFEFGHNEALEAGRKEIQAKLDQVEQMFSTLGAPFRELDDQVEKELLTLVVSMVRQLVRREIRTDPNHIIGVMREALAILPVNARDIRVKMHPEDAEIVREMYKVADTEQGWQIEEDPVLQRGGCRVVTESSQVDASLESRLNNLIAPLLAGLRSEDQDEA